MPTFKPAALDTRELDRVAKNHIRQNQDIVSVRDKAVADVFVEVLREHVLSHNQYRSLETLAYTLSDSSSGFKSAAFQASHGGEGSIHLRSEAVRTCAIALQIIRHLDAMNWSPEWQASEHKRKGL